jgi:nickel-dependent lactate racemase
MRVELPYGATPYRVELGSRAATIVKAAPLPPPRPIEELVEGALDHPQGGALAARPGDRVTLIVSDPTRDEPRETFVSAIRRRLPEVKLTIAVATGTHGPCELERLCLSERSLAGAAIVNHDGHRSADMIECGTTSRGTPVIVHRCLVETDLIVATGCIKPHYFAGFGAGVKALFPGLGAASAIRTNHRLKTEPLARAGILDGNPCREDLEDAVRTLDRSTFLLDGVCGPDERIHEVVAGDPTLAFRRGADQASTWFRVRAPRASLVIASDRLPVTASLYQAAKIAAAAAPLVAPGGTLAIVAQCPEGIGPLEIVNEAIFRIGVLPRLADRVRLVLVSALSELITRQTLCEYAPSVASLLDATHGPVVVIPRASELLCEAV